MANETEINQLTSEVAGLKTAAQAIIDNAGGAAAANAEAAAAAKQAAEDIADAFGGVANLEQVRDDTQNAAAAAQLATPQFAISDALTDAQIDAVFAAAIAAKKPVYVAENVTVGSINIGGDLVVTGPGTIGGTTSGTRPTYAALMGAADAAGRLSLLTAYYTSGVVLSDGASITGGKFTGLLFTKSGSMGEVPLYGDVEVDDVAFHGIGINPDSAAVYATDLTISDPSGVGIYATRRGVVHVDGLSVVAGASRGLQCYMGGVIDAPSGKVGGCASDGAYIQYGGTIKLTGGTLADNGGHGFLTNYGGDADLQGASVNDNGGSGIVSEGGRVYAQGATVTGNDLSGLFVHYGGIIQASGATVTGNGQFAADARDGLINILTATVSGNFGGGAAVQIRSLGAGVIYSEAAGGAGKTALVATSYSPAFGASKGGGYIGASDGATATTADDAYLTNGLSFGASQDVRLERRAADTLSMRRGANPQRLDIYNTDDGTNYERLALYFGSNFARILSEAGGTGTARDIILGRGGVDQVRIRSAYVDILRPTQIAVGTDTSPATNGGMTFTLTSNTTLRVSVRGTDGTVRSANITLA